MTANLLTGSPWHTTNRLMTVWNYNGLKKKSSRLRLLHHPCEHVIVLYFSHLATGSHCWLVAASCSHTIIFGDIFAIFCFIGKNRPLDNMGSNLQSLNHHGIHLKTAATHLTSIVTRVINSCLVMWWFSLQLQVLPVSNVVVSQDYMSSSSFVFPFFLSFSFCHVTTLMLPLHSKLFSIAIGSSLFFLFSFRLNYILIPVSLIPMEKRLKRSPMSI